MSTSTFIALTALLLILAAVVFWVAVWPTWRRRRILQQPFPPPWRDLLYHWVPWYRVLPADLRGQLEDRIKLFLADKRFVGVQGQVIDDTVRLTVAGHACLLLLNRHTAPYPALDTVLVYPTTFVAERDETDAAGLVSRQRTALHGESWSNGKVILAWDEVRRSVRRPEEGYNVVLHEFAHQLDHEDGSDNGAPVLARQADYAGWASVLAAEFAQLRAALAAGEDTFLDPYGATNEAEFFAVVTETFFGLPRELRAEHPHLYGQLLQFYRVDPAAWLALA